MVITSLPTSFFCSGQDQEVEDDRERTRSDEEVFHDGDDVDVSNYDPDEKKHEDSEEEEEEGFEYLAAPAAGFKLNVPFVLVPKDTSSSLESGEILLNRNPWG
jgi:hypothetical protein